MKKLIIYFTGLLFLISCKSQTDTFDGSLKKELDDIMFLDQSYRKLFDNEISDEARNQTLNALGISETEFKQKQWGLVLKQDSINLKKVEAIISKFGYPGKSMVGEPTNKSAWYVIQHSNGNKIKEYLPLIKKAAQKGELPFKNYAQMLDRFLMYEKKPQIYGTQGFGGYWFNPKTQKEEWIDFIWPVENPTKVNELRKEAGFNSTVEENAKDIYGKDFNFKNISLDEAIKISNYKKKWD